MKSRNKETTEGIELPNQVSIRILVEKENYNYFGVLKAENIRRKLLEIKLYGRNVTKGINTRGVPLRIKSKRTQKNERNDKKIDYEIREMT